MTMKKYFLYISCLGKTLAPFSIYQSEYKSDISGKIIMLGRLYNFGLKG